MSKILQNPLKSYWDLVKISLEMLPSVTSWGSPVDAPQRGLARFTSILQRFGECLWGDLSLCSFIDFDKIVSKVLQNALGFHWNLVKIPLGMLPSVASWGSPADAPQRGFARFTSILQ